MSETIKNNKAKISLIVSISVIFGIVIGYFILPKEKNNPLFSNSSNNLLNLKFSYIFDLIENEYVDDIDIDSLSDKFISSFLEQLDPHSTYLTTNEYRKEQESLNGEFEGIGVQFRIINDTIVIIQPLASSPSIKAGIRAGDKIISINDSIKAGEKIDNDQVMRLLKGKKGSVVKLGIKREGVKELILFSVKRDIIPTFSVEYQGMLNDNTGYIKIEQFSQTTSKEVNQALHNLLRRGMKQLVIDLRGNGGGYLEEAYKVADEFLAHGDLIVYTQGRKRGRNDLFANDGGMFEKGKVIVLIDEFSASAAEIVSGALQDNDRALIMGRRTFGKGLVQEQKVLPDGSAIRITVSRYYTPSGRCIQRPYIKGKKEKYFEDFVERYSDIKGEKTDSTYHQDKLKYKTKKGRIVYGGGGIEPDISLPYKKTNKSNYYIELINKGILYKYCFDYSMNNRNSFKEYVNGEDFIKRFDISEGLFKDMMNYADKNGIKKSIFEQKDKARIMLLMKAYMAETLFNDKYYYSIFLGIDDDIQKAIHYFNYTN